MDSIQLLKEKLRIVALEQGFSHFGITPATPMYGQEEIYRQWVSEGYNAGMKYLERNVSKRFNPGELVEGARSVIIMAIPYGDAKCAASNKTGIALFAWGEDYHTRLRKLGRPLMDLLATHSPGAISRFFTDSAPLSERSLAVLAGLGWIGKNSTVITPESGSMVWLCAILTTLELPPRKPFKGEQCGSCTLCIDACPTKAIVKPGILNTSLCIAYHTNTSRDPIPEKIAENLNGMIFGCDICQLVCPWNNPKKTSNGNMENKCTYPSHWPSSPADWLDKDEQWFADTFSGSSIEKNGFVRMLYQARVACYGISEVPPQDLAGNKNPAR